MLGALVGGWCAGTSVLRTLWNNLTRSHGLRGNASPTFRSEKHLLEAGVYSGLSCPGRSSGFSQVAPGSYAKGETMPRRFNSCTSLEDSSRIIFANLPVSGSGNL